MSIDPATQQWRENFSNLFEGEAARTRESLQEIKAMLSAQNGRVRKCEYAIASLKTWVALVGGMTGLVGIASVLLQSMVR